MASWVDLGASDLYEGELRGLEVGEQLVLVACHEGVISALDDSCNHAGCLLSGGWIDAKRAAVICPCHEYAFELRTGRNVTRPRLCGDQRSFPVRVEGGRVYLALEG
jgi:3-phenylpropionate/trans-cinnamate dioxygenase ferredoxin component